MTTHKIGVQHLARRAILYVRQSSAQQVQHHQESRRLQYAMQEQLRGFGWTEIEVIDEDLGRSAAGHVARAGFERLIAEVCLGHVGAVAAREVSRFARNSREWQRLVEVCRMVDTLLIDQESVYQPRNSNDRLLLGLKGSLNEYELDLLRQRAWEARREKAKRGELVATAPVGFQKTPDQRIELDPDQRVQGAIRLIFQKCQELGSVRAALFWLIEHGLQVPTQRFVGSQWELHWRRPDYRQLYRIVTNPVYGGAYAYGRTETLNDHSSGGAGKRTRRRQRADWIVLLEQHHAGYVSWEEFERLQALLKQNSFRRDTIGAAKRGSGLLSGVLRCRRCGRRLLVTYGGRLADVPRYTCVRGALDQGESRCLHFGGRDAEWIISREIVRVVQPAAVEAAVQMRTDLSQQNQDCLAALERDLIAAEYEAARCARQYHAADPENRLVTGELERRWNASLQHVSELQQRLELQRRASDPQLPDPAELARLPSDLQAVWEHPEVDVRIKKRIIRTLIREIIVDVDRTVGELQLVIHWQGGAHTEVTAPIRKRGQNSRHSPAETVEAIQQLALICNDQSIASYLNRNGIRTGTGNRWTKQRVTSFRAKRAIPNCTAERRAAGGWMSLTEAATHIGLSPITVRKYIERGELTAFHPLPDGPWIIQREQLDPATIQRLKNLAQSSQNKPGKRSPGQRHLDFSGT